MNLSFRNGEYRPQRIKPNATEPAGSISLPSSDVWATILVVGISLLAYSLTVAPSVAAGDHAELQYIPFRLGIPHPNGYPFYIFLGWLWSWLPVGTLAWRMNMLSAVLGSMGVGLTYLLLRVTGLSRKSSVSGSLVWAFQRTFWVYAGLAHRYTLLMLLGLALLFALMLWRQRGELRFFLSASLLAGLGLANHIAAPLFFVPGTILLIWPRQFTLPKVKLFVLAALLVLLPVSLYAYIPLRGVALWSVSRIDESYGVPLAVLQGIIHPRFAPDANTLWQYFIAGTPSSVNEVLVKAGGNSWFVPLLIRDEFGIYWLIAGLSGLLLAFWRNRVWGAALWSLFVVDFMLALYWRQGNVNAYFLPADFAIVVGLTELLNVAQYLVLVLIRRIRLPQVRLFGLDMAESLVRPAIARWLAIVIALAGLLMPWAFFLRNWDTANHSADLITDSYWRTVLALDIEKNAGILAHWSDLTPFWYFQQAEDLRPDLKGLYLPNLNQVRADLARGGAAYLAGPLAGWYDDLQHKLRLIPWGPLVKMVLPEEPIPTIEHTGSLIGVTLDGKIELRTVALPTESESPAGTTVPLTLTWTTLARVQRDLHISLRLRQHGQLVAQQDDRIVSPWFAQDTVEPGLDFWSLHELYIPEGLQPDQYELWAVVYEMGGPELPMDTGGVEVNLGTLKVVPQIDRLQHTLPITTLAPCLELISVSTDGATVLIGSNFGVHFLWKAHCPPAVDVGLRFFLEDGESTYELGLSTLGRK